MTVLEVTLDTAALVGPAFAAVKSEPSQVDLPANRLSIFFKPDLRRPIHTNQMGPPFLVLYRLHYPFKVRAKVALDVCRLHFLTREQVLTPGTIPGLVFWGQLVLDVTSVA